MPSFLPEAIEYNKQTMDALLARIYADVAALEALSHQAVSVSSPLELGENQELSLGLVAKQAWTPEWANLTLGSGGTTSGYYYYNPITGIVDFCVIATLGNSGFSVGAISLTFPVTPLTCNNHIKFGDAVFVQGTTIIEGMIRANGGVRVLQPTAATGYITRANLSSTIPFTWAAGDSIYINGRYPTV